MADVYATFTKALPFCVRLDNGTEWDVTAQTGMKSGYLAIVASQRFRRHGEAKFYILSRGKSREVQEDIRTGFYVKSGTPERGLVSAMRRAGVVTLRPSIARH